MAVIVVALIVLCVVLIVLWAACDLVSRTVRDNGLSQLRIKFRATLLPVVTFGFEIESRQGPDKLTPDDAAGPSSRLLRNIRRLWLVIARELGRC